MTSLAQAASLLIVFILSAQLAAQNFDPPKVKGPDQATLQAISERTSALRQKVQDLRTQGGENHLPNVEVYLKAAEWIVRHGEFFHADSGKWTLAVLDQGLKRAGDAAAGKFPWLEPAAHWVSRGYRSRIDGSVQPYAVSYPPDYGKVKGKTYRLDIVLHGRDASLTEVKFLYQHGEARAVPKEQEYVQLEIYGRGNNAYRWAGEEDVWEALADLRATEKAQGRGELLDPRRVVLRGFSMGGAGTWHLGLHHPDRFAVIGPGAGFTTTHGYIKDLTNPLPPYQEACLRIYDAVDYTESARMVPIVAYSGEIDAQKAAADNIAKRLDELGIHTMTHLIAPRLAHQFPAEWQKKAEVEWSKWAGPGKGRGPDDTVAFTTYTLRYPSCAWVEITGLEHHYQRASIEAKRAENGLEIKTENIHSFRVRTPDQNRRLIGRVTTIDGEAVDNALHVQKFEHLGYYVKQNGKWQTTIPPDAFPAEKRPLAKIPGLQGPIDDAFTDSFVCVIGTGKAWHEATARFAEAQLERFRREWDKYLRGTLPVVTDKELTEADIAHKHLILFGDPASNSVLGKVIGKLPLKWSNDVLEFDRERYDAATHVPVLIYPNPLNPSKYVVLNTGHTFHEAEFKGTNAQLYPRLGDYAILKPTPTKKDDAAYEVIHAGLFDELWKMADRK
jgi:pimeloyl-ACP methyl ester carboxylesterase